MRAIRQHEFGGPETLRLERLPDLSPGPGQVRIRVLAAGVHLLDAQIRSGLGPPRARVTLPMTPGREVAGHVDAVGSDDDSSWVGRYVVADLGVASGGYAELAIADVPRLHGVAGYVDPAEAVAAIGTGRTAQAILELAEIRTDDIVVVTGAAGGVGAMLTVAARRSGARVIGLATGAAKAETVVALGGEAIDSGQTDWPDVVQSLLGPSRASLVLDGVGGSLGAEAMALLRPGGRLVMFGTASGSAIPLDAETVYNTGIAVSAAVGARLFQRAGGLRDLEEKALAATADRSLVPHIGQRFSLAEAPEAHRAIEERRSLGKVVLVP
ncbi:zinc-binding dehydrogenase [Nakamurella lactea]|uniref:zinc-binding dehydrogenase n=1 Tax=Nakamurella lactea TaxID=459515 RepID=UPI0009FC2266|nr:zinc-binding dehydrogenase [Nakamurella lactea]